MGAEETLFQRFGKEFPKGTVLFREGEPGKEMFVLQSGKVAISKKVRDVEKMLAIARARASSSARWRSSPTSRATPPPPSRRTPGSWSSTPRRSRG